MSLKVPRSDRGNGPGGSIGKIPLGTSAMITSAIVHEPSQHSVSNMTFFVDKGWPTLDIPSWSSHLEYTWPSIGKPKLGKLEFRMLVGLEVRCQKSLPCAVAVLFEVSGGPSASSPYERRSAYLIVGWNLRVDRYKSE